MGLVVAKIKKPLRRFNIDNRARAVISKEKPTPAPRYAANERQLKLAQKLNPNFLENHYKKDLKLDEHLKNVYLTSTDPQVTSDQSTSNRPLPQSRHSTDFEFGFYIPDRAPVGKCTLKQIFDIVTQHREDSTKYNVNYLAAEYRLDEEKLKKLLHYYKLYHLVYAPKKKDREEEMREQLKILAKLDIYPWSKKKKEIKEE